MRMKTSTINRMRRGKRKSRRNEKNSRKIKQKTKRR
jgi:hypothetical protein